MTPVVGPSTSTLRRRPRSARRTSHIDMRPLGDTTFAGLELMGAARDLRTDASGFGAVDDEGSVHAVLGEGRVLEELATSPAAPEAAALLGLAVAAGFRAAVAAAVGAHDDDRSPLRLLLDDLPVASLIAGYGDLYKRADNMRSGTAARVQADICAGWASDAEMVQSIRSTGQIPVPMGPDAPELLGADGDELAWHPLEPLAVGSMRRRRRIDVVATDGSTYDVDAMFRDSHVDPDGAETVLHEWAVTATVDRATATVAACRATPHVLPWGECPTAAGSAARLVGQPVAGLRRYVGDELRGTTTCTHLNDLFRSLADAGHLLVLAERDGD